MAKKFNRQIEDYILTDLLPYEKGNYYTNIELYEYILLNNFKKKFLDQNIELSQLNSMHSAPLKFKVKNKDSYREISIPNPLSTISVLMLINRYSETMINSMKKNNYFSVRVPHKHSSLLYKKSNKSTVKYETEEEKSQILISLESSGSYFKHKPWESFGEMTSSNRNEFLKDKYQYVTKFDIENFFSSIYTHSFKWLATNNPFDGKNFGRNQGGLLTVLDKFAQNMNGSKTNGIVIGPEFSRLIADFLLIHVELKIVDYINDLENIKMGEDFEIIRFVDDYYLYTNKKDTSNQIVQIFSNILNEFQLKMKDSKFKIIENMSNTDNFIKRSQSIIDKFLKPSLLLDVDVIDNIRDTDIKSNEIVKNKNNKSNYFYKKMKNEILNNFNDSEYIYRSATYFLSTILSILENNISKPKELNKINYNFHTKDLINLTFFLTSLNPNYTNIQKLVAILMQLVKVKDQIVFKKEFVEESIFRFQNKIFTEYPADWINFLLFCSSEKINLSISLEKKLVNDILKNNQGEPRIIAGLLIYLKQTGKSENRMKTIKDIDNLVLKKIRTISTENFFEDINCWWLIIFNNCEYEELENTVKFSRKILDELKFSGDEINSQTKEFIINFLKSGKGFIRWDFLQEKVYQNYYFFTQNRTLFNPGMKSKNDAFMYSN